MFCANATGTHKVPLLIIGKSVKPRCFKNINMESLPVTYMAQKSARMDKALFKRWYVEAFLPQVIAKHTNTMEKPRKVLLLLDKAPSHPAANELNKIDPSCQIMYLPPNTTSIIQPMDQGVIEKTKKLYRKQLLRELMMQGNEASVIAKANKLTLKDCCYNIASAWKQVTDLNITHAWNQLLKNQDWEQNSEARVGDVQELMNMLHVLPGYENASFAEVKAWIQADRRECGWKVFEPSEILSRIQSGSFTLEDFDEDEVDIEESESEGEEEPPAPTIEQASEALKTFQRWSETRWEFNKEKHEQIQAFADDVLFIKHM